MIIIYRDGNYFFSMALFAAGQARGLTTMVEWRPLAGRLAAEVAGPDDGQRLVFLHGFTQTANSWKPIAQHFVARHVRVPVQHRLRPRRRIARRNVRQKKLHPLALQPELQRPREVLVAIAQHHVQRRTEAFELRQHRRIAHIAQVPDLVRPREPRRQRRRRHGRDGVCEAPGGHALLCLNAPEIGSAFLQDQVREHAPELVFEQRLPNPPVFADIDPERALKVLVYRAPELPISTPI